MKHLLYFLFLTAIPALHAQLGQQYLIPQQYGAIPNDGKDDTPALQKWIDEVSRTKITGYLPAGVYQLFTTDRGLYFDGVNCTFTGDGESVSILQAEANMEAVARINAGNQVFSGIGFNANRQALHGLLMLHGAYCSFRNCGVGNALSDGILLPGADSYTKNSTDWSARDLIGLPGKSVFNDPLLWEEVRSGHNGLFYCSRQEMVLGGPDAAARVLGGKLQYSAATQIITATGGATFKPAATGAFINQPRKDDLIRIPVVYSSAAGPGVVQVQGKAHFAGNDSRIRIDNGQLYQMGLRNGDAVALSKGGITRNFTIDHVVPDGGDTWISLADVVAAPAMQNAEFTIKCDLIFAIDDIRNATEAKVTALTCKRYQAALPVDLPPSDYAIMVGDGVREEHGIDNHINVWIGGLFRANAGSGRSFRATAGHNILGGFSDHNGGYAITAGDFGTNSVTHDMSINKFYSESNICGNILLGRVKGAFVQSIHAGARDPLEYFADGTFTTFFYAGTDLNRSGIQIGQSTSGINFGDWNLGITKDEGIPVLDNRASNKIPLLPIRGTKQVVNVQPNSTLDVSLQVSFYKSWIAKEAIEKGKYIPEVTLIGDNQPVTLVGIFQKSYNEVSPALGAVRFSARIKNDNAVPVQVEVLPQVQFFTY